MKKRLFAVIVMAVLAISATGCSSSDSKSESSAEKSDGSQSSVSSSSQSDSSAQAEALEYDKIIVGLDDTFAPMGFRDENGELAGVDIELMTAVSDVMGIPFELQPIDWTMKETELNNKNIDLIWNGYSITDERREQVNFSQPYLNNKQIVVTLADSDINSLADLSGKIVAAQDMSSAIDAIDSKPEVKDTFGDLVTFETNDQCLRDLEAGRSDAVVADEVLLRYYISQKGEEKYKVLEEDFGSEEYGIGVRKEDEALLNALNNALDTIKENGTSKEISEKWFGSDIILK